jgi:phage-related protein
MAGWFIYNGLNTANINGLEVTGQDTYTVATRNINHQAVSGRSGDLLSDEGTFKQVKITYHCTVEHDTDIETILDTIMPYLMTAGEYKALSDSYHSDTFRLAVVDKGINIDALRPNGGSAYRACNFDIVFSCRPERFLTAGNTQATVSNNGTVNNPTAFPAYPLLEITGTGTVNIGSQQITIASGCASPVFIDCETMDAYSSQGANLNSYVTLPLAQIKLFSGNNTITYSGVSSVKITPRTWKI